MSDGPDRILRDIEDLLVRIRTIEAGENPFMRQHIQEFRDHVAEVKATQRKVADMDVQGTAVTRERFRGIEERLSDIRGDVLEIKETIKRKADADTVREIKDDQKTSRNMVRSALIAASLSLAVNILAAIILFVLLK